MLVGVFTTIIILNAIVSATLACWSIWYRCHAEGNSINYTSWLEYVRTVWDFTSCVPGGRTESGFVLCIWFPIQHISSPPANSASAPWPPQPWRPQQQQTSLSLQYLEYLLRTIIIPKAIVSITIASWSIYNHYHTEGSSINYTCILEYLLPLSFWRQWYQLHLRVGVFTTGIMQKAVISITLACCSIYYHYHTEGNSINYNCFLEYL